MDLRGRCVAITGGSSGIGLAAALIAAKQGAHVAVLARGQRRLDEAVAALRAAGGAEQRFAGISVDVTDDGQVQAAIDGVLRELGGLDVLICNSGYARAASVSDMPMEQFSALLDTNLLGHVRVVKAALPHFKRQGSGAINLVTSMLGFMSMYGYGAYSASKFGIVGFAEALRQEMAAYDVAVGVFYPPTTDTPGLAAENEDKPPLTWKMESTSRKFSSEDVAEALIAQVRSGAFTSMAGADSWAIYRLSRWFPALVRWVIDRDVWAWVKQHGRVL